MRRVRLCSDGNFQRCLLFKWVRTALLYRIARRSRPACCRAMTVQRDFVFKCVLSRNRGGSLCTACARLFLRDFSYGFPTTFYLGQNRHVPTPLLPLRSELNTQIDSLLGVTEL